MGRALTSLEESQGVMRMKRPYWAQKGTLMGQAANGGFEAVSACWSYSTELRLSWSDFIQIRTMLSPGERLRRTMPLR